MNMKLQDDYTPVALYVRVSSGRQDVAAFGKYRTKEMVLAYMNALAAGDTEEVVAL